MQLGIFQHKIGKIDPFLPLGIGQIFGPNLKGVTALIFKQGLKRLQTIKGELIFVVA